MGKSDLKGRVAPNLDPELIEFLNTYVDSFLKWELLRFFHENPHTFDTAEGIARHIGRAPQEVQNALLELKERGLLKEIPVGGMLTYSLSPDPRLKAQLEKFVQATDDREFRRKAIYHLVR